MGVYLTGDIHGMPKPLIATIKALGLTEEDTMILLGDAGLNFHKGWKDKNKKKELAKKTKCNYFVVRGNHDDDPQDNFVFVCGHKQYGKLHFPRAHWEIYFDNLVLVEDEFPQIKYAVDGLIYTIDGMETLVIGGGYSVDKYYRLENGWHWVWNELLDEGEMEDILETYENNKVDVILSHVAPEMWECYIKHLWMDSDGVKGGWSMIDKSMEKWMNKLLWREKDLKLWYFGHYHANLNCGPIGVMLYDCVIPFGAKAPAVYAETDHQRM